MINLVHPRLSALKRFADREAGPAERRRIARHLEECLRCRREIGRLRLLASAAHSLPVPPLRSGGLAAVLERRAAGERRILQVAGPQTLRPTGWRAAAAAAAVILLVFGWAALAPLGKLQADTSGGDLYFTPHEPRPGAAIQVEYRAGAALLGERRLRLRAHLMGAGGSIPGSAAVEVAQLERGRGGTFRGSFVLPDSIVYAVFAVEDLEGTRVDANGGTFWELLVHHPDGRPHADALLQRRQSAQRTRWGTAYETARRMTELYPDDPRGWRALMWLEKELAGAAAADSVRAVYRVPYERLHALYATQTAVEPGTIWTLIMLGSEVRHEEAAEYWRERGFREHPEDRGILQQRVFAYTRQGLVGRELLDRLDALHGGGGSEVVQVVFDGWRLATQDGDPDLVRVWGERLLRLGPEWAEPVAVAWSAHPELAPAGRRLLERALEEASRSASERRPVDWTSARWAGTRHRQRQRLLVALARGHLLSGEADSAQRVLEDARRYGLDSGVERLLGAVLLEAGDMNGAGLAFARVYADPRTPAAFADSARLRLGGALPPAWESWVAEADSLMREDILAEAETRRIRRAMRLVSGAGEDVTLAFEDDRRLSVVAFLSRWCPPSNVQAAALEGLSATLAERGVRLVVVTGELPSEGARAAFEAVVSPGEILYDVRSEARNGFRSFGTPHFFIVDDVGKVQFDVRQADALLPRLAALQGGRLRDAAPVQARVPGSAPASTN
jgi:hypothetical protein